MKKSQKTFIGISTLLIASALIGTSFAALYLAISPKALAPYLLYPIRKDNSYKNIDLKPFGVAGETVNVPIANGGHLSGFYFPREGALYTVLISHGQGPMENQIGLAHAALASNLNVFIYDYQGYGNSSGKPSTSNMLNDGLSAFDYLVQKKKIKANRIINMGSSLGTGIASSLALKRTCAAVLLIAPYTSLAQAARDNISYFKLYPSFLYPQPDLCCLPLMESARQEPIAIIHGTRDTRIPIKHSRQLAAAYKGNHEQSQKQSAAFAKPAASKLHFVELNNCDHGNIPLQTITDEINDIVNQLEAPHALLSKAKSKTGN